MTPRVLPASVGQRLLWVLDRYRGATGALNCPLVCRVRGPLDHGALGRALDGLAARHESLRTTFAHDRRHLEQVVAPEPLPGEVRLVDLPGGDGLAAELAAELARRVDPTERPSRATLWRLAEREHVLCLNLHHLVTDTWSCDVLFRELPVLYASVTGGAAALPPVTWQYAQFALWQQRLLGGEGAGRHREYWLRQLDGLRLADAGLRPAARAGQAGPRASVEAATGPAATRALRDLARRHDTTLFAVLLAVFYARLYRLSGQRDITVASLFANRTRREVQRTVGFLANLVLLRVRLPGAPAFDDVVRETRATVAGALAHQAFPYHLLPGVERHDRGARPDDVVFQMLPGDLEVTVPAGELAFTGMAPDVVWRFDLELALMPAAGRLRAKLSYGADRIGQSGARALLDGYVRLAAAVAAEPSVPLERLAAAGS